ncbi:MAG: hypothetical protein WC123_03495 [Bacilli bacterium]
MKSSQDDLVFLVGADGCGKSYFSSWLQTYFVQNGYSSNLVWSRFNNYFSKPILGILRVTGHNYYKEHDGIRFGYHDFENFFVIKTIYIISQMLDVNIATYFKILRSRKKFDNTICERGPFDTLVDVLVDVNMKDIPFKKIFFCIIKNNFKVFFIDRDIDKIISSRNELKNDFKLCRKIDTYRILSEKFNWVIIDNNGSIDNTKKQILKNFTL